VLEAVPNVSEGRDTRAIAQIGVAFSIGAVLLDVHSDADHHRSVFTLAGEADRLVEGLVTGASRALALVDLSRHVGVHPRIGVVDVVPIVPLRPEQMPEAESVARVVASRLAAECGLPVFLYARSGGGRRPAFFRRGGPAGLARRLAAGELWPDLGPGELDPRKGAVLVGARPPLVAYNVDLATGEAAVADAVARAVRESSGGMRGVQAIGLRLPQADRIQVSMNVLDLEASPLHEVVERVRREARALGVEVAGGELVGLVPAVVLEAAERAGVVVPGVDASRVLERVLEHASL
jgi:glutamate formiminotransferase/glutamate formiminotransferase/formiminotetrahydrofolate cyclodeaminase